MTEDVNDLNINELIVISHYIPNRILINGPKFDLRVYVVVTSYELLRVYAYKERLVRFASELNSTKAKKRKAHALDEIKLIRRLKAILSRKNEI
jgi:tubulin polyglutamylase TTLL6/13